MLKCRNINVIIRWKNYLFLSNYLRLKKTSTVDFLDKISKIKIDKMEEKNLKLNHQISELKTASNVFNLQVKQLHQNIKNRVFFDDYFFGEIQYFISEPYQYFLKLRNEPSLKLHQKITLEESNNFSKKKKIMRKKQNWTKIRFPVSDEKFHQIYRLCEEENSNLNRYFLDRILLFQNQNTGNKEHILAAKKLLNLLVRIKNNANQIYHNKKKYAYEKEVNLAKKLSDELTEKIEFLLSDPLLYGGKKFSENFFKKVEQ